MNKSNKNKKEMIGKVTIIGIAISISMVFMYMIKGMLMPLFFAIMCVLLTRPIYFYLLKKTGEKKTFSSLVSIVVVTFVILVPLIVLLSMIVEQSLELLQAVRPFIENLKNKGLTFDSSLKNLSFYEYIAPYNEKILKTLGEFAVYVSEFFFNQLSNIGTGALSFFSGFFIMLYAMFFLIKDGNKLLQRVFHILPLSDDQEKTLVERFVSVSKAAIKGVIVIGLAQGLLAGVIFYFCKLPNPAFWGAILAVATIIPVVGSALVWLPAAIYLWIFVSPLMAIICALTCGVLVSSVDNFLRPIVVGKDSGLPDLLIFISTLGGLSLFGISGIIIGPLIAALFVSIWDIYLEVFKDVLPKTTIGEEKR